MTDPRICRRTMAERGPDDGAGTEGSQAQGGAEGLVADGYGNEWPKCSRPYCALEVVRPGKVQCDCEHAGNEEFPAPADPAGLDAAIEAAAKAISRYDWNAGLSGRVTVSRHARAGAEAAVRAAAPHLRAAALNEAADEIAARAENWPLAYRPEEIEAFLRERAGREATT